MRVLGYLPVVSRRSIVALGAAAFVAASSTLLAGAPQDPQQAQTGQQQQTGQEQQAQQPEAPDMLKFSGTQPVDLIVSIVPGQEMAFEQAMLEIKSKLAASAEPQEQAQARQLEIYKLDAPPAPGAAAIYILRLSPPVAGASYDFVKLIYESKAFNAQDPEGRKVADAVYEKLKVSIDMTRGINPWPLRKIG